MRTQSIGNNLPMQVKKVLYIIIGWFESFLRARGDSNFRNGYNSRRTFMQLRRHRWPITGSSSCFDLVTTRNRSHKKSSSHIRSIRRARLETKPRYQFAAIAIGAT